MQRVILLIDADNIPSSYASRIFPYAATLGRVTVKRAYGRQSAMTDWQAAASEALCDLRPLNNVSTAKNGTDIALAIDAIDILHGGAADIFCIVSNDRDFVPLALRLRDSGKHVHAICKQSDERHTRVFDSVLELDRQEFAHRVVEAFRKLAEELGPEPTLAKLGGPLRKLFPGEIPTSGKWPLRRTLEATGRFEIIGSGTDVRVRLTIQEPARIHIRKVA